MFFYLTTHTQQTPQAQLAARKLRVGYDKIVDLLATSHGGSQRVQDWAITAKSYKYTIYTYINDLAGKLVRRLPRGIKQAGRPPTKI